MKKVYILVFAAYFSASCVNAADMFSFIDNKFDDFVNRVVPNESDKLGFRKYYTRLQEKMKESKSPKQRATRQYLYQVALDNLAKKHEDWHKQINSFFTDARFNVDESFDTLRGYVRHFLVWYGAYEEYLTVKLLATHKDVQQKSIVDEKVDSDDSFQLSLWENVTSYISDVGNTIASWFGLAQETTTV